MMPATVSPGRALPDSDGTGTPEPLLRVSRVTAGHGRAGEHLALRSLSLEAFGARTLGIIGESGSGKTTLGRVIAGLIARHLHCRAGRRYHCGHAEWQGRGIRTDRDRAAAAPSSVFRASAKSVPDMRTDWLDTLEPLGCSAMGVP